MSLTRPLFSLIGIAVLAGVAALPCHASDHVVVIGGGPDPYQSQVSLEDNVLYFRSLQSHLGLGDARTTVLFGAGSESLPDVCHLRNQPAHALQGTLARLFGRDDGMDLQFRPNRVQPDHPATRLAILAKLRELSTQTGPGDRLLLYVTGHGGLGTPVANGYFYTWQRERIHVQDLAKSLDAFDPEVQVLVVMVQCYGGCFANLLFTGGEQHLGLAPHRRAGFFATLASRPAAGCSADTARSGYQEYSSYFWASLGGKNRLSTELSSADFDEDGNVSATEAHSLALMAAPTIDVSLRTSDWFLSLFAPQDARDTRLFRHDRDYSRLLGVCGPIGRPVVEHLTAELSLGGESRIAEALRRCDQLEYEHLGHQEEMNRLRSRIDSTRASLTSALTARWPSFKNAWHPDNLPTMENQASAIESLLADHKDFATWQELCRQREEQEQLNKVNQIRYAQLQRLIRLAQSIAHAKNLESQGGERWEQYLRIVELEEQFLRVDVASHTN